MYAFGIQQNSYMIPWAADMFRGIPGSMNILWNQGIADLQAKVNILQVPAFNSGTSMYPNVPVTGYEGLLNPAFTWNQQMWNNSVNGCGYNSNVCGFNPEICMSNPIYNPYGGFTMGNLSGSTPSSSSSSSSSPEQKKYNRLLNFLKKLNDCVKDGGAAYTMTAAQKDRLDELSRGSKEKDINDKYDELKKFYDELPKEDLKQFIKVDSENLTINGREGADNMLLARLTSAGFETQTSIVDLSGFAAQMHDALTKVDKADANIAGVMHEAGQKDYPVLEVLSTYYSSEYKKDDLIDLLFTAHGRAAENLKDDVKKGFKELIEALVNEAKLVATEIGGDTKEKLIDKADKLNKAYDEFKSKDDIEKLFKEVYVMTRLASTKVVEKTLADTYGEIDNTLFKTDSFIMDEVKKDLKKEGFEDVVKDVESDVKLNTASSDASSNNTTGDNTNFDSTTEEAMLAIAKKQKSARTSEEQKKLQEYRNEIYKEMQDADVIENTSSGTITIDGIPYAVYKAKTTDGSEKYYYLNNEFKFVEVKKNGSNFEQIEDATTYTPTELQNEKKEAEEKKAAHANMTGHQTFRKLKNRDYDAVNNKLMSINKDNVVEFLQEFNWKDKSHWGRYKAKEGIGSGGFWRAGDEGLFEHLADEEKGKGVNKKAILNVLQSVLDYAKDKGQNGSEYYDTIEGLKKEIDACNTNEDVCDLLHTKRTDKQEPWVYIFYWRRCNKCEQLDRAIATLLDECGVEEVCKKHE